MVGGHIRGLLTEAQRPRLALGIAAGVLYSLAVVVFLLEESVLVDTLSRHAAPATLVTASGMCGVAAAAWLLGPVTRFERLVGWAFAVSAIFAMLVASIWWAGLEAAASAWIFAAVSGWTSVGLTLWISMWSWRATKQRAGVWVAMSVFLLALALAAVAVIISTGVWVYGFGGWE